MVYYFTVKYSSTGILLLIDPSVLPVHFKGLRILEKLFFDLKTNGNKTSPKFVSQDLWIKDWPTTKPLARVAMVSGQIGYKGVILDKWLKLENYSRLRLNINVSPGPSLINDLVTLKPIYFVVFAKALALLSNKCNFLNINIPVPTGTIWLPKILPTKICSSLEDTTFPYNDSSLFDVGQAVKHYLIRNPLSKNSSVLKNPKCCHPVQSISANLLLSTGVTIVLENSKVTECGCY